MSFQKSVARPFRSQSIISKTNSPILNLAFCLLSSVLCLLCFPFVAAAGNAAVTLTWEASSGNVAGYFVHYGKISGDYQYHVDVKNNTTCTISGLDEGTTYYYAATAYDPNLAQSDLSEEIAHTTPLADANSGVIPNEDESNDSGTGSNGDTSNGGTDDGTGSQPPASSSEIVAAINAGGPEYVDMGGIIYQADTLFSGGSTYTNGNGISYTKDEALYQSERYGNFSYKVPLDGGNYEVTFKFAEIYWNSMNRRIFDVEMEGNEIISNLDIFAKVGRYTVHDVTVPVSVTDGVLNIDFFTDKDNAKVSALLIRKSGDNSTPPPDTTASDAYVAINAGGPEYVDVNGIRYQADTLYSSGRTFTGSDSINSTKDDALYQSERYGDFSYKIPLVNGNYIVTLKFAEIYWGRSGKRIFDVEMEENEVISNLDIFAKAGRYTAYDVTLPVSVADGVLDIDFFTEKNNAKVSALLIQKDQTVSPSPPKIIASGALISINAGGPEYVDAGGTVFQADTLFSGGSTYTGKRGIGYTEDDALYQSERYGDFSYDIPVPNGNYIVTLKFAEIYWNEANRRVFDVEIQGKEVISDLDIFAAAGSDSAHDVNVPVSVSDGVLKIDFFTDKNNAKVSAIMISK